MSKHNYVRSEAGNITVIAMGNNLIISVNGIGSYIVTNPDKPGPIDFNVKQVEISDTDTLDDILKRIEQ